MEINSHLLFDSNSVAMQEDSKQKEKQINIFTFHIFDKRLVLSCYCLFGFFSLLLTNIESLTLGQIAHMHNKYVNIFLLWHFQFTSYFTKQRKANCDDSKTSLKSFNDYDEILPMVNISGAKEKRQTMVSFSVNSIFFYGMVEAKQ